MGNSSSKGKKSKNDAAPVAEGTAGNNKSPQESAVLEKEEPKAEPVVALDTNDKDTKPEVVETLPQSAETVEKPNPVECNDVEEICQNIPPTQTETVDNTPAESEIQLEKDMELEEPFAELSETPAIATTEKPDPEQEARDAEYATSMELVKEICSPTVSYSLASDQWAHRKEGLEMIQKCIERNNTKAKTMEYEVVVKEFSAICVILRKFFEDRVAPVYFAAYDCFRALLKVYAPYVDGPGVMDLLRSLAVRLLNSMGGEATGTNRRTQKEACRCMLRIARLTHVDGLAVVLPLLTDDACSLRPRLALLKLLVQEFRIEESSNGNCGGGISSELVMSVCHPALSHPDDKTRKAAVDNIGVAYSMAGKSIKMLLGDVKPATLKVLERKFAEIDGVELPVSAREPDSGLKKRKSKKRLNASKSGENIRNLAPVLVKSTSSFMSSTVPSDFTITEEVKNKENNENSARVVKPASQQQNKDDSPQQEVDNNDRPLQELKPISRQLFMESAAEGSYGNGGCRFHIEDDIIEKTKKPNSISKPLVKPRHVDNSRFVIDDVC
mmetsp:Transcript_14377/g.21552  ORF Transcript_14377/g.21552 Transcript_14377/m.21552 type:complete len:556 (+) Transcript_14377:64-1731(+)